MLVQVDDVVINTDKIRVLKINDKANYVVIHFDEIHNQKVTFPNYEDLHRFLGFIGREKTFA